jgi:large subunit ribosomal protein L4
MSGHGWARVWAGSSKYSKLRSWAVRADKGVVLSPGLGSRLHAWVGTPRQPRTGMISVPATLFGNPVRVDLMQRLIEWESAAARAPSVATKTRSTVQATNRKPFRQKGTGRARQGQFASPLNRKGGKAHGKKNRSYAIGIQKAVRRAALRVALSTKFQEDRVVFWEYARVDAPKTKEVCEMLKILQSNSVLIIDGPFFSENFVLAARNLPYVTMATPTRIKIRDLLKKEKIVITVKGLKLLEKWLSKSRASRELWKKVVSKYVYADSEPLPKGKKAKTKAWKDLPFYRKDGVEYGDGRYKYEPRRRLNRFQKHKLKCAERRAKGIKKRMAREAEKKALEERRLAAKPKFKIPTLPVRRKPSKKKILMSKIPSVKKK